jgi:hypothetical protein
MRTGTFVARYSAQNSLIWAKAFKQTIGTSYASVYVSGANEVILTTNATYPIDVGGGPLTGFIIAKYSANNGNYLWSGVYPGYSGQIYIYIYAKSNGDFLYAPVGGQLYYYSSDGKLQWQKSINVAVTKQIVPSSNNYIIVGYDNGSYTNESSKAGGAAVDASGATIVFGDYDSSYYLTDNQQQIPGSIYFGSGPITGLGLFLLKLSP